MLLFVYKVNLYYFFWGALHLPYNILFYIQLSIYYIHIYIILQSNFKFIYQGKTKFY